MDFATLVMTVREITGYTGDDNALESLLSKYIKDHLPQYNEHAPAPTVAPIPSDVARVVLASIGWSYSPMCEHFSEPDVNLVHALGNLSPESRAAVTAAGSEADGMMTVAEANKKLMESGL